MKVTLETFIACHVFILCVLFTVDQQSLVQCFPYCDQAHLPLEFCGLLVCSMYKIQMLMYFKDLFFNIYSFLFYINISFAYIYVCIP